jgi:hypothetical protein
MTAYDPQVIHDHADRLYLEATRAPVLYAFAGGIVALTAGLGLGLGLESWAAGIIMGVVLGAMAGFVGWVSGRSVGARMKLAAQTALCQVAIEKRLQEMGPPPKE